MNLDLRAVKAEDELFLFEVYASTRAEEMALVGWDKPQQEAFLRMQFNAQRSSYAMQFPNADYRIIVQDDRAAGRLIVDRSGENFLLIDIALLPQFRNKGVGSALIKQLMAEAADMQKPLKLHVEKFNRALRLYERFGFSAIGDNGLYVEMIWRPDQSSSSMQRNSAWNLYRNTRRPPGTAENNMLEDLTKSMFAENVNSKFHLQYGAERPLEQYDSHADGRKVNGGRHKPALSSTAADKAPGAPSGPASSFKRSTGFSVGILKDVLRQKSRCAK